MAEDTYYLKIRGRVLGPFPMDRLKGMAKQSKLTRVHKVSTDNSNWVKAGDVPAIWEGYGTTVEVSQEVEQESKPPADANEIWHYGINGESFGPVTQSKIIELIGIGQLGEGDLIWREGMDEWKPAASLPAFSRLFNSPRGNETVIETDVRSANTDANLERIKREYTQQLPWVMFIGVNVYLVAIGQFFAFIAGLVRGGKQSDPVLITSGLVALVYTVFFAVTAYYLQRHNACSRRFTISAQINDLEESVSWLRRVWQSIGYMLIMFWVLVIIAIIYSFTITQALI